MDLVKAVKMQEAGGRGTGPMQCSECGYYTTGGHIQDPILSIDWGIHTLADILALAEVESPIDMEHACQERWDPIGHYEILGYGVPAY